MIERKGPSKELKVQRPASYLKTSGEVTVVWDDPLGHK